MKRSIGPYTVELTGDLITVNKDGLGTVWGNTYPISQVRKQFNQVCEQIEKKVYNRETT